MMNIKHLRGENFCQYPVLNQALYPGMTCLLGLNGTGKSNMIRGIYLCLVGEVYGAPNLVRDGHSRGFIEMDAEVPQGMITITRKLKHNDKTKGTAISHELRADWLDEPLTKKADVNNFLAPYIGVTTSALENIVFALQGEFDNLMLADHMPRARMLSALMGLERAEKLRDTLKRNINTLADLPDRTEQIAHVNASLAIEEPKLVTAEADLVTAEARMTEEVKQAYAQARTTLAKRDDAERNRLLEVQRTLRNTLAAERTEQHAALAQIPEATDMAPPATAAYSRYMILVEHKDALVRYRAQLTELQAKAPAVVQPIPDELRQEVQELHTSAVKLREKLQSYGTGVCPTCDRAYDEKLDVAAVTAELDALMVTYDAKYAELEERSKAYAVYTSAAATHKASVDSCEFNIQTSEQSVTNLADVADFDEAAYKAEMQVYADSLTNSSKRAAVDKEINRLERGMSDCDLEIARLETTDVATVEQRQLASNMVTAYDAVEAQITAARNERDQIAAGISNSKQRISMLSADMSQAEVNKQCREMLQFARDQLHTEKLPRLAAQGSIAAINRSMKKYLDMFAFPYGFRLNEDCDFVVDFDTSKDHPAIILSGGERVRAAMAMRFGLMDVFSAGCGFLVIDEPTTFLDSEAIGALMEVLGTASTYFKTRNIKIICPTHAQQLSAVADSIITLGD